MSFEEFKARYEELLEKAVFNGSELQVSDEEIAKIFLGLLVLEEHRQKVEKEWSRKQRKRQLQRK